MKTIYFSKLDKNLIQEFPVPNDLENWIEYKVANNEDYSNLSAVEKNGKWVVQVDKQRLVEQKQQAQTQAWENIKAERYKRTHSGVYLKSINKWFHTDEPSRIQYLSIQQLPEIPENLQWKTMDNSFVIMTKELLNQLLLTMIANEQADFANAEKHRLAMLQAANPLEYDYSTGWSEIYEQND